ALEIAKFALQHYPRQFVLLDAVKAWQIALQETLQTQPALSDISRGNFAIGEQSLRGRLFEQRQPCRSPMGLFLSRVSVLAYRFEKKGYSPTSIQDDKTAGNRSAGPLDVIGSNCIRRPAAGLVQIRGIGIECIIDVEVAQLERPGIRDGDGVDVACVVDVERVVAGLALHGERDLGSAASHIK